MDDEVTLVSGDSKREKKTSYKDLMMEVGELEEPDPDFGEPQELLNKKRHHSEHRRCWSTDASIGNCGAEPELCGADSSCLFTAYPDHMPQDRLGIRGEEVIHEELVHSLCTPDGSTDQGSQSSVLEYWVYLDDQQNRADSPVTNTLTPPATPVTHRSCQFIPVPSSVTASPLNLMVPCPTADTCSPISSMSTPTASASDTLRSTSRSPGCADRDPVSAAAHLHLLGESLSLIGQYLQETDKMVSMSSSLSLLLDSLLCALPPLICLTSEVPELRSCTQHTLPSTLENIAYVMPGM